MSVRSTVTASLGRKESRPYRYSSLVELAECVVHDSDRQALHELHDYRTVFKYRQSERMLLAEYLERLRRELAEEDVVQADQIYYLTLDKFSNLPPQDAPTTAEDDHPRGRGPDCRNYFRAFLKWMVENRKGKSVLCAVEEEGLAARSLQGLIRRHFSLSRLECVRKNSGGFTRYDWMIENGRITVFLPRELEGRQRRAWLEEYIPDADPGRPDERERIQDIINKRFQRVWQVSFEDQRHSAAHHSHVSDLLADDVFRNLTVEGLARFVSEEKAQNIDRQRPAIRALGSKTLKKMILDVFETISEDAYEPSAIAKEYNLSKSTMSRFAGTRWAEESEGEDTKVPDLWFNTSCTLAKHPVYIEAAQQAGVWKRTKKILHSRKT